MNGKFTRDEILEAIRAWPITVRFTKVDGTRRDMRCTLNDSFIPVEFKPKVHAVDFDIATVTATKVRQYSDEVIRAFDCDKMGWRSFRVDSVEALIEHEDVGDGRASDKDHGRDTTY